MIEGASTGPCGCYTRCVPRLSPFTGLVFDAAVAGPLDRVTAPPYDVISGERRLDYLAASPFNVVHLDLAEGPQGADGSASRYARAADLLAEWERRGVLRRPSEPCYYAYEMTTPAGGAAPHTVRGLICAMDLEDWGGTVLPHERVMDGPVQDRLALLRAARTHLSPVYGTIHGSDGRLETLVREGDPGDASPFEALDEQSVRHRMWPVPADAADLSGLDDQRLLIADGHHRYTTALRYRDERRRTDGPGPWDAVLTLVVDSAAERLPVLPFHRVQLAGEAPSLIGDSVPGLTEALAAVDDDGTVAIVTIDAEGELDLRVRRLQAEPPTVRALHAEILDGRCPPGSLRYLPDAEEAVATLRRGDAVAVYLLPPTTPERISAVIERGERLPQKSTYFWPKPRTGMVMMPLDPAGRAS